MKKFYKKSYIIYITFILSLIPSIFGITFSQDNNGDYLIIPVLTEEQIIVGDQAISKITSSGGYVWDNYNNASKKLDSDVKLCPGILGKKEQFAYFIKFLSIIGIVIGAIFIIKTGYKYMLSIFKGCNCGFKHLKNFSIGALIIIFSYGVLKTITTFFLCS